LLSSHTTFILSKLNKNLSTQENPSLLPAVQASPRLRRSAATLLLNKVIPTKYADQLYGDILAAIVNGTLPEGEKLPSENELASSFGVSRPVVREALSRLRADSVIVSRRGSGSYVQRRPSPQILTLTPISEVADLMRCMEFRIAIEGETAALAATRRTDKNLSEMRAALKELDANIRKKMLGADADIRFHNAISEASKNKLFTSVLQTLSEAILKGMTVARKLSLQANTKRLRTVQAEHLRIFEAINNKDSVAARRAVRTHIENARARVLSYTMNPTD